MILLLSIQRKGLVRTKTFPGTEIIDMAFMCIHVTLKTLALSLSFPRLIY